MTTIAYRAELATVFGCTNMALFASQCLYWMKNTASQARDGWFYKTRDEWLAETGLSRYRQENVRKRLRALGVLEENECRKQWRTVKWYRINKSRLYALVNERLDTLPSWCLTDLHDSTSEGKGKESSVDNTGNTTDSSYQPAYSSLDISLSLSNSIDISIYRYIKSIKKLCTIVPEIRIEEVITQSNKKISETTKSVIYPPIVVNGTMVLDIYRDRESKREQSVEREQGLNAVQPMHNPSLRTGTNVQPYKQDAAGYQASGNPPPGQPHTVTTVSRRHDPDAVVFDPKAFRHCHPMIYAFASSWLRYDIAKCGGIITEYLMEYGWDNSRAKMTLNSFDKERGHEIRRQCEQTLGWYQTLTDADLIEADAVLRAMA